MSKFSFICAHPDDEMFVRSFIQAAVKKGHDVEIISMTKGEYGTFDPTLKGERLAAIRVIELQNAAKLYGVPKEKVKFLGLIDGRVGLQDAINALRQYFLKRKPNVIYVPEYNFSIYVHPDHLNTGRAACILLKREISPRPLLFTYHSFKNTLYNPIHLFSSVQVIKAHKSQIQVIIYLVPFFWLYSLFNGFFCCRRFLPMEGTRRVFFKKKIKISFLDTLFSAAASFGKFFFKAWTAPKDQ
jgi:LmbE family N-acetylglucosaminyl deacetylase